MDIENSIIKNTNKNMKIKLLEKIHLLKMPEMKKQFSFMGWWTMWFILRKRRNVLRIKFS